MTREPRRRARVPRFDDGRYVTAQMAYLLGWGGVCVLWPPLSATHDRAQNDPGLPESLVRVQQAITWYELACRFADLKWARSAGKTRRGIADALATVTPAIVQAGPTSLIGLPGTASHNSELPPPTVSLGIGAFRGFHVP